MRPPRRSVRSLPKRRQSVYPLWSSMSDLRGEEQKYFCYFAATEKADGVDGEDGVKMNC